MKSQADRMPIQLLNPLPASSVPAQNPLTGYMAPVLCPPFLLPHLGMCPASCSRASAFNSQACSHSRTIAHAAPRPGSLLPPSLSHLVSVLGISAQRGCPRPPSEMVSQHLCDSTVWHMLGAPTGSEQAHDLPSP